MAEQYDNDADPSPSPRTQFMWADDLFAYLDSVELQLGGDDLSEETAGVDMGDMSDVGVDMQTLVAEHDGGRIVDGSIDPSIANRRAKNRLSAQLSRRRKKQYISCLETRLKDLRTVDKLLDDTLIATRAQNTCLRHDINEVERRAESELQPIMQTADTGGDGGSKRQRDSPEIGERE